MIRIFNLIFDFSKETHKLRHKGEGLSVPLSKGDVTRDNSQRRFSAQHSVALLELNVGTMLQPSETMWQQCCVVLKIVVANRLV